MSNILALSGRRKTEADQDRHPRRPPRPCHHLSTGRGGRDWPDGARHPCRHPPPSSASVMRMAAIHVETEQKRRTDLPAALKNTAAGAQHGGLAV